ncbi:hypothetical protein C8034_v010148 [Colletotrichum sidae]|uniref:Uncharacterized protein n=4 Tax=Colletotrichum orbiculare species complex TaxID=2707354 RepID=N4W2M7_COLOR|nr:hypothetical protein Cob_v009133 [Colletotrichum orbiculare MAFF 240422]TDZ34459.1 hypothetical protein C8035_v010621 [Colletotrichum spinosum]TDZ45999.1 hypothetical protein CTRI78_v009122 [Colletotrichum trifolii]TEA18567.1 hypothetical protein C8034_v010148 [Colletotrichum sidae]
MQEPVLSVALCLLNLFFPPAAVFLASGTLASADLVQTAITFLFWFLAFPWGGIIYGFFPIVRGYNSRKRL